MNCGEFGNTGGPCQVLAVTRCGRAGFRNCRDGFRSRRDGFIGRRNRFHTRQDGFFATPPTRDLDPVKPDIRQVESDGVCTRSKREDDGDGGPTIGRGEVADAARHGNVVYRNRSRHCTRRSKPDGHHNFACYKRRNDARRRTRSLGARAEDGRSLQAGWIHRTRRHHARERAVLNLDARKSHGVDRPGGQRHEGFDLIDRVRPGTAREKQRRQRPERDGHDCGKSGGLRTTCHNSTVGRTNPRRCTE